MGRADPLRVVEAQLFGALCRRADLAARVAAGVEVAVTDGVEVTEARVVELEAELRGRGGDPGVVVESVERFLAGRVS